MYYCNGCDDYHDSKGDAGYNSAPDLKQYCDDTVPYESEPLLSGVSLIGETLRELKTLREALREGTHNVD